MSARPSSQFPLNDFPPTIASAAARIASQSVSPIDLTELCLGRIQKLEPSVRAMTFVDRNGARSGARVAAQEIVTGRYRGPLHGIPVVVKDTIDIANMPTLAGSMTRPLINASKDAEIVSRLRLAGAVLLGKAATWEYAIGETALKGRFARSRNPLDTTRDTGGSSSGSAAAVAAGECILAVGTDTGGSTRCPAAWCGVTGFKPSYGVFPTDGVVPLSASQDTLAFLTRTPEDAQLAFSALCGNRAEGSRSLLSGLRFVTWPSSVWPDWSLSPEVALNFQNVLRRLRSAGVQIEEVPLPALSFYDHVSIRLSRREAYLVHRSLLEAPRDGPSIEPSTRDRFLEGERISEDAYTRALELREQIRSDTEVIMNGADAVIMPSMHCTAPKAEKRSGIMSAPVPLLPRFANCLGLPSLTIPTGSSMAGMPIGTCINGPIGRDEDLLAIGVAMASELGRWPDTRISV